MSEFACGDLTEVPTDEGKLYLADVEDLASRRVLGFGLSEHHDAELATNALKMAVAVRGGHVAGVIFHSDRGCARLGALSRLAERSPSLTATTRLPGSGRSR